MSRGETRKESKEAVRETFSAAMYAASARVANLAHLCERDLRTCKIRDGVRDETRAREYKVLFSKFMIVNKF